MGVPAGVMARDSQASSGYWDIVQDSLADVVRIMLFRCHNEQSDPELYKHVRNLRGEGWLCEFPNLFVSNALAEWRFPRPYWLEPYSNVAQGLARYRSQAAPCLDVATPHLLASPT